MFNKALHAHWMVMKGRTYNKCYKEGSDLGFCGENLEDLTMN